MFPTKQLLRRPEVHRHEPPGQLDIKTSRICQWQISRQQKAENRIGPNSIWLHRSASSKHHQKLHVVSVVLTVAMLVVGCGFHERQQRTFLRETGCCFASKFFRASKLLSVFQEQPAFLLCRLLESKYKTKNCQRPSEVKFVNTFYGERRPTACGLAGCKAGRSLRAVRDRCLSLIAS